MRSNIFPENLSQNKGLSIRIVSPEFGHLSAESVAQYGSAQRLPYYFFLFVLQGSSQEVIDGETIKVGEHELLFAMPHQLRQLAKAGHNADYYKLGFDDECLSRLPKKLPFLLNPLNQQKISFPHDVAQRLWNTFKILNELLRRADTDPELILAYLNSMLTEINAAYFVLDKKHRAGDLDKFLGFKLFVEDHFTDQPAITEIAEKLALSTDCLYRIVKQHSGVSPKEYITDRLIIEARRRIYNNQHTSVKELAYELGFNDPGYFSRLFKKVTGKTVAGFYRDLSL
ncbi:AraC family transcriptional regulator [Chryseobacterium sp. IHB B 17019]|uniref:AraC family transcriptional regulator n=1 Tax=Chryseobacterium sp. IHB B 17019 TaxID=1721091 RepID=UPI000721C7AF|nr:helix-turn-helix domain-containing protein [Chryseobacterium sp. IHB B 17019]ALR29310.1 AraC family transcriptional regulator [Chryseobacterium sp. IHB B 17019]